MSYQAFIVVASPRADLVYMGWRDAPSRAALQEGTLPVHVFMRRPKADAILQRIKLSFR